MGILDLFRRLLYNFNQVLIVFGPKPMTCVRPNDYPGNAFKFIIKTFPEPPFVVTQSIPGNPRNSEYSEGKDASSADEKLERMLGIYGKRLAGVMVWDGGFRCRIQFVFNFVFEFEDPDPIS